MTSCKSWLLAPLTAAAFLCGGASAHAAAKPLRVCADPNYMPYSNRAGQGFENKVAQVIARAMGRKLEYHWASYRGQGGFSNFLAENLDARKCDVVISLPYGDNEEAYTNPYYRSSYVFIYKQDKHYHIRTMNSVSLRSLKIGFENDTTPESALKILGLTDNGVPFNVGGNPHASPKSMLQAVQDGKVGVMITWEPAIGYFLKDYPGLKVERVPTEQYGPGLPAINYTYAMAMGVRKNDDSLKAALNQAIKSHQAQIDKVLAAYNVRLYPDLRDRTNQSY
ncbi:MAG TPA: quinoprotein dehydrogenase-associated putative ABC transporter substrate-binding protein [Acetobacteraceae bacterium]|nr:quinoprotein dehydrogenase-associated putative ABC transporter substrate-binding protein [Acetobacteraceae bacterium]